MKARSRERPGCGNRKETAKSSSLPCETEGLRLIADNQHLLLTEIHPCIGAAAAAGSNTIEQYSIANASTGSFAAKKSFCSVAGAGACLIASAGGAGLKRIRQVSPFGRRHPTCVAVWFRAFEARPRFRRLLPLPSSRQALRQRRSPQRESAYPCRGTGWPAIANVLCGRNPPL